MKPWSASSGAYKKTSANAPVTSAAERSERVFRPRPNTASILQQEVEDRVGEQPEDEIIEAEDRQPARLERLGATRGQQGRGGPRPGDDERQRERDGQQRHQQV